MQRSVFIAAAAAATIVLGAAPGTSQAQAAGNYQYCLSANLQEGLDCEYQTFQQCVAAIAGVNRTCVPNPFFAGSQSQIPATPLRRPR